MSDQPAASELSANLVEQIKIILDQTPNLENLVHSYKEGDLILEEGRPNQTLFVILDGNIELIKGSPGIRVDRLDPGALLGLLSYATGRNAFTTAVACSPLALFHLQRADYDQLGEQHPELKRLLDSLTISNLASRYRRSVTLNQEMATLTDELKQERNRLQQAITQIEHTRTALISHEKMATLGQLVAGVAHELNNPASALQHSIDRLVEGLPAFAHLGPDQDLPIRLLKAGMEIQSDPDAQRQRLRDLEKVHPRAGRPLLRAFTSLPAEAQQELEHLLDPPQPEKLQRYLQAHQMGVWLRSVQLSGQRIINLVRSLKNYSRHDDNALEETDLRQGLYDTLLILKNRLRQHQVDIRLAETPTVRCRPGSINQVWTNLIMNAAEAMKDPGLLTIVSSYHPETGEVCVTISDTGPGIPSAIRDSIFEMNFTTKTGKSSFGLGLGLAISREIIQEHGGRIELDENTPHGARFKVCFPAATA